MTIRGFRRGRVSRMPAAARRKNNAQPAWPAVLIAYVAILLYVISPARADYPALIISVFTFSLVQLLNRRARFDFSLPVSPLNIGWVLFALQLVVLPLLSIYVGFTRNVLPWLPSEKAINIAILISTTSYVGFIIGVGLLRKSEQSDIASTPDGAGSRYQGYALMGPTIIIYILLGLLGFQLYHGGLAGYVTYLTSPLLRYTTSEELGGTLAGAASTFLRPFLAFGIALFWCYAVDRFRQTSTGQSKALIAVTFGSALALLVLNLDYNRATTIGPLLALLATFALRVRRLPLSFYIVLGAGLLAAAFIWGQYRQSNLPLDVWLAGDRSSYQPVELGPIEQLQVYAAGPQFSGFLLEETGMGDHLYWGKTLLGSLLYPIPILGKSFRDFSGVTLYNRLIYGSIEHIDQVVPFQGELFINFHIGGVLLGYILLGYLVARAQRNYLSSTATFETYAWFFIALWLLFLVPGSLAVTSQILTFSLLPVYVYFVLKRIRIKHGVQTTTAQQDAVIKRPQSS